MQSVLSRVWFEDGKRPYTEGTASLNWGMHHEHNQFNMLRYKPTASIMQGITWASCTSFFQAALGSSKTSVSASPCFVRHSVSLSLVSGAVERASIKLCISFMDFVQVATAALAMVPAQSADRG